MQTKGGKMLKGRKILLALTAATVGLGLTGVAHASVKGRCDMCHTMHNSQSGTTEVHVGDQTTGDFAGWDGTTGKLDTTVGLTNTPINNLLKTDCVGCHSATTDNNIITIGGNNIPIVFNTSAPTNVLAGGNFYWTTQAGGDNKGHNVWGIAGQDVAIAANKGTAPGNTSANCANSCHQDLARDPAVTVPAPTPEFTGNGCQGCHLYAVTRSNGQGGHHNQNDSSYRFLGGHGGFVGVVDSGGGTYEDPDWEATVNSTDHNFYKKQTMGVGGDFELNPMSIGRFCAGCHSDFHSTGHIDSTFGVDNGGDTDVTPLNSPWLRHPTNVDIPVTVATSEYFGLNATAYNPLTPVAQDPAGNADVIDNGDQVMCLSCHRAHGSPYEDMLRFDYLSATDFLAHTPGTPSPDYNGDGLTDGCFYCHRQKDS